MVAGGDDEAVRGDDAAVVEVGDGDADALDASPLMTMPSASALRRATAVFRPASGPVARDVDDMAGAVGDGGKLGEGEGDASPMAVSERRRHVDRGGGGER